METVPAVEPLPQYIVDSPAATPSAPAPYPTAAPGATVYYAPAVDPGLSPLLLALAVVLAIVVIYCCRSWFMGRPRESLADSLAARGWVLYTRPGCSFCFRQYYALGLDGPGEYPKQVECSGGAATASSTLAVDMAPIGCKSVKGFPFWLNEYTQASRTGYQDATQLREMVLRPDSSA